jgi:hypothetical protein
MVAITFSVFGGMSHAEIKREGNLFADQNKIRPVQGQIPSISEHMMIKESRNGLFMGIGQIAGTY